MAVVSDQNLNITIHPLGNQGPSVNPARASFTSSFQQADTWKQYPYVARSVEKSLRIDVGRQHEIRHQHGLGAWRGGLSIAIRQIDRTSPGDESGSASGFVNLSEKRTFGDRLDSIGDVRVYTPRPMLQWFYLAIRYQIWSLPKDPAELRKLAFDLQVPLVHAWTSHGLDTSLLQSRIRERLRKDAPYVMLFLVIIFSVIALFVFLLAWISRLPSLDLGANIGRQP